MIAMTVRQPYARCIAAGRKNIENRGRPTSLRGEIAIHAGREAHMTGDTDRRVTALFGRDPRVGAPLGAIVAVAKLVDCHPWAPSCAAPGSPCLPWGERGYGAGPAYHLVLADVHRLEVPVPCRGMIQVGWTVPADVETQVREQLAGVAR